MSSAGGACVWLPIGNYIFCSMGIGAGYHRLLTHRGYKCPLWLEHTLAILGCCNLQESPARWVVVHRLHHQHSDHEPDPHTPMVSAFWSHVGWLFIENRHTTAAETYHKYARDVLSDRFYMKLERNSNYLWVFVAHAVLFFVVGLGVGYLLHGTLAGSTRSASNGCCGAWSIARSSPGTSRGPSTRLPICGATAITRRATTAATTGSSRSRPTAKAGTTTTTPTRVPRPTAIAGGKSTSPTPRSASGKRSGWRGTCCGRTSRSWVDGRRRIDVGSLCRGRLHVRAVHQKVHADRAGQHRDVPQPLSSHEHCDRHDCNGNVKQCHAAFECFVASRLTSESLRDARPAP